MAESLEILQVLSRHQTTPALIQATEFAITHSLAVWEMSLESISLTLEQKARRHAGELLVDFLPDFFFFVPVTLLNR